MDFLDYDELTTLYTPYSYHKTDTHCHSFNLTDKITRRIDCKMFHWSSELNKN
jgi:hypothetical protein